MRPYQPASWRAPEPAYARARWLPPGLGTDVVQEAKRVAPEFKEAGNWLLATGGFVAADFLIHQLLPITAEEKTPPYYYANKLIWTIPALLVGRLLSDYVVKGSDFVRALTIGTTANLILAVRYLKSYPADYILTVGAIHEALLVPLSYLIIGPSPATGFFQKGQ
jgi:hypothetical protein